jgi:hypothetical protein
MTALPYSPLRRSQAGVALLISIFVLMLISVMALSLVLASGTETALAGNYRSSASAYYAALAGLEEGRGRLLPKNPNYLGAAVPTPLPLNQVVYILNPAPGEVVTPTAPAGSPGYPDTEYGKEFPAGLGGATVTFSNSVSSVAGLPPALYKWVRITPVTEKSLNLDVNGDGTKDSSTALYYDTQDVNCNPLPRLSLSVGSCPASSTAVQALEVTSLAALPDGSQKLMQYVVAPVSSNLNFAPPGSAGQIFPAALTLVGNNVYFLGPNNKSFEVNGNDQFSVGSCTSGSSSTAVSAIGYTNSTDSSLSNILGGIAPANQGSYFGAGKTTPSVVNVNGLPPNMQTPSGLDALVQTITQNADAVVTGPVTQSDSNNIMPPGMSASNPMTVVVNGDLIFNGWHNSGYGLLVVTGTFKYDPDASWNGVILVIGQGDLVANQSGRGQVNGAMLVARTRDDSGNLLPDPNLGSATVDYSGGGLGIYYSSCWIKAAQTAATYKILSYRQLSQ